MTASMVANRCKWLLRQKKYGVPGEVIPLVLLLSAIAIAFATKD